MIGPPGTPREYGGSLAGTPVFVGSGDSDSYIPSDRVLESARVLERLGGEVTLRLYPGMGHVVNRDQIRTARRMLTALLERRPAT